MANQELHDYVKTQLDKKVAKEKICADLASKGWKLNDIDSAISGAMSQSHDSESADFRRRETFATIALITGVVTFIGISPVAWFMFNFKAYYLVGPIALIGFVLSIISLKSSRRGMAITGLILNSLGFLYGIGMVLLWMFSNWWSSR